MSTMTSENDLDLAARPAAPAKYVTIRAIPSRSSSFGTGCLGVSGSADGATVSHPPLRIGRSTPSEAGLPGCAELWTTDS